jgi:hypothetical protein
MFFCFFMKICLENFLGSGRMYGNKIFFCFFVKEKLIKNFEIFLILIFFKKSFGENRVF